MQISEFFASFKRSKQRFGLIGSGVFLAISVAGGQTGNLQQPHQHPPATPTPAQTKPPAGAEKALPADVTQGPRMRLEDLEKMALQNNPSLKQAAAGIRAAQGRRRQAGLYPNPVVGYIAEEVAPTPTIRYGEHGAFVEQRIVTAGKLGIARRIAEQDVLESEAAAQAQRYRVLNAVRSLYYQALGEQKLIEVRSELAKLARRAVAITMELANVGQADRPDLAAVEIEAQRLELGLITARNSLERTWRQLAAVTSNFTLKPMLVEGDLENLPKLDYETALAEIFKESPEVRTAQVEESRAELVIRQARAAVRPDIVARGGVMYNRELLEVGRRPVGWEGLAEIGITLPLFNRNQGNIAAAKAEAERARLEVERTRLSLRSRLAAVYKEYQDGVSSIERYQTQMIPKARQAYEQYLGNFRQMAAAYPQVIIAQRNLFQLQEDYVAALVSTWQRSVEMQGLLLMGGMETAGEMRMPAGAHVENVEQER